MGEEGMQKVKMIKTLDCSNCGYNGSGNKELKVICCYYGSGETSEIDCDQWTPEEDEE
jgi:hypothetical protein